MNNFKIIQNVFNGGYFDTKNLTPTARLVLLALANHFNAKTMNMYPSLRRLAYCCGCDQKQVQRSVNELMTKEIISAKKTQKYGRKHNIYSFSDPFFADILSDEKPHKEPTAPPEDSAGQSYHYKYFSFRGNARDFQLRNKEDILKLTEANCIRLASCHEGKEKQGLLAKLLKEQEAAIMKQQEAQEKPVRGKPFTEFTRDEAINYVENLPKKLRNSESALMLIEKYSLTV